jgi:hypothetical protein
MRQVMDRDWDAAEADSGGELQLRRVMRQPHFTTEVASLAMTVTELRRALEQLETEGRGARLVVIDVPDEGETDYEEIATVRVIRADRTRAANFDAGSELVLIE